MLAQWQSTSPARLTPLIQFHRPGDSFPKPRPGRPCSVEQFVYPPTAALLLDDAWLFTSSLRILNRLLAALSPQDLHLWSFRFYPPHCYQASLAGTSSLLRTHLPPRTLSTLESPLASKALPSQPRFGVRLPPLLQAPSKQRRPASHHRSDRVSDFALFRRLAAPVVPYQVQLRYVSLTSYGFLQTQLLPATPLPFGLSSPRSG